MSAERKATRPETKETAMVTCIGCDKPVEKARTFMCRKCKRSPFCFTHLDQEFKTCSGCAFEKRVGLYNDLLKQEKSLRGFLRLVQFIFILSAILFSASRLFAERIPDYVRENIFFVYVYLWGGLAVFGMAVCYVLLFLQKKKSAAMDEKIHRTTAEKRFSRLL
jgi:hypothetical protein